MNRLIFLSTIRSKKKTLPLMLTAFFCSSLLYIGISWIDGIHTSLSQSTQLLYGQMRVITQDFRKRESLFPIASNISPLIIHPDLTPKISFFATLEANQKQIQRPILGFPKSYLVQNLLPNGILTGRIPHKNREILIGASLAKEILLSQNDTLVMLTQTQDMTPSAETFQVSGIIKTENTFFDHIAFIGLEDAQWMTDMEGATELIAHTLSEEARKRITLWSTTNEIPIHVQTWEEKEPYASVRSITDTINQALLFFILSCATLSIFNISLINMKRVQQELGILRSMGATKRNIIIGYMSSSLLLIVLGMLLGIIVAHTLLHTLLSQGFPLGESLSQASYTLPMAEHIYPNTTWNNVLLVAGLISISGILGSMIPCIFALRKDPIRTIKDYHQ